MTTDPIDSLMEEVGVRADLILQNAESFPYLLGLAQKADLKDEADRRAQVASFIGQHRSQIAVELRAIGVDLGATTSQSHEPEADLTHPDSGSDSGPDDSADLSEAIDDELIEKERFADSNRARAYISSTF